MEGLTTGNAGNDGNDGRVLRQKLFPLTEKPYYLQIKGGKVLEGASMISIGDFGAMMVLKLIILLLK